MCRVRAFARATQAAYSRKNYLHFFCFASGSEVTRAHVDILCAIAAVNVSYIINFLKILYAIFSYAAFVHENSWSAFFREVPSRPCE